ncbi:SET domain-containing protein SmydA-8-like isoform X2 [Nymphalis io]|uniref:SET domain-containing protein SmydA-8-like isoform X2 n=1 Tax=Inachis io TaxID=171585 RepID=UPI0021699056|nr:SET domain-containing protein SmydA-8-like isoform X2 [Nymphalis io]
MTKPAILEDLPLYLSRNVQLPFKVIIGKSPLGGRGLFTGERIKKGSLIFVNEPIVYGPRANCEVEKFCSNCFHISDSCYPCGKCYAFVCSDICNSSSVHIKLCAFICDNWRLNNNSNKIEKKSLILARMLIYIQFLFLSKKQKDLLGLFQRGQIKDTFEDLNNLQSIYCIPDQHIKFLNFVQSIIKINSFRISHSLNCNKIELRGLYPLSAFMNHSCIPNTRNVFTSNYFMAIYATRDIEKGDEITSCYTGLLWCTPARRYQLYKSKNFWCFCARCNDKTEMGTILSALKCFNKPCIGNLLPINPVDSQTKWFCDNCRIFVPYTKINMIQSVLGSLVGALRLDDEIRLENYILQRLTIFIPYSNHVFVDIHLRLAIKLGFSDDIKIMELSESRLDLKENLCRGTLRTVAALGAGDAHLRGLLLYHLHAALAERARRSPDLYEELKSEIEITIEQAYNILQGDISAPPDLELRRQYLGPGCDKSQEERFFILDSPDKVANT